MELDVIISVRYLGKKLHILGGMVIIKGDHNMDAEYYSLASSEIQESVIIDEIIEEVKRNKIKTKHNQ
ncbi:conserved hypothetical protein [Ricinus communis]|uniref:Uncharacterized protein n=1 Tax=Ricinus communis TaxID=3988 RepID=B9RPP1_RICCO|nr:conserved hypothetical protein [Ricinus communis]